MGDRFYEQQKNYKPKRRLKKDVIAEVHKLLGAEVPGLDRMTIASIDALYDAIYFKIDEVNKS
jgi:hypothetical protein